GVPHRASPLLPQHATVPSRRRAHVCSSPTATCTASPAPSTFVGGAVALVEPVPHSPCSFFPQHVIEPSLCTAHAWLVPPALTCTTSVTLGSSYGVLRGARPGAPRTSLSSSPQHPTEPAPYAPQYEVDVPLNDVMAPASKPVMSAAWYQVNDQLQIPQHWRPEWS